MDGLVLIEGDLVAEALAADVAAEGASTGVGAADVDLQAVTRREDLRALQARVQLPGHPDRPEDAPSR